MIQKIIRVGNSYAVTIPKSFADEIGLKPGRQVVVEEDVALEMLTIQPKNTKSVKSSLTPEFLRWLKKFNAKYKDALTELAKR